MTHSHVCHVSFVTRSYEWHDSFIRRCITALMCMHIHVWHDSFARVPCLVRDLFVWVTWLIQQLLRNGTHVHSYTRATWHIRMCAVSHSWLVRVCDMTLHQFMHNGTTVWEDWLVSHDSFVYPTWLIRTCGMNHSHVWYNSFACVTWLICMCDMTRSNYQTRAYVYVTWIVHFRTHSAVWE